jgi:hypothetical protein
MDKAVHHWRQWFKFVNDYLFFPPQKETMTQRAIVATIDTWEDKKVKWAKIVQQKKGEALANKLMGKLVAKQMFSVFYISKICRELPCMLMWREDHRLQDKLPVIYLAQTRMRRTRRRYIA